MGGTSGSPGAGLATGASIEFLTGQDATTGAGLLGGVGATVGGLVGPASGAVDNLGAAVSQIPGVGPTVGACSSPSAAA